MQKYRDRGIKEMPIAIVFGVHPAYEIMANFSGMHMDLWGEMEMVGTIMDMDVEMVPCETIDLTVPAHAEIVVEGLVERDAKSTTSVASTHRPDISSRGTAEDPRDPDHRRHNAVPASRSTVITRRFPIPTTSRCHAYATRRSSTIG